ncbi:MAG: hypothetical protein IPN42_00850 [Methylococcaceae bacterium]|nr:hypothetical protein [Methylococcaceae bacterium]
MQEKRTEIVKFQGIVKTIPSHQQLMRVNKMLMGAVFFLMVVVFILGLVFVPNPDIVTDYNKIYAVNLAAQGMNPVVSKEVNNLKGQLIGIVSGSIEGKLITLEESIKSGSLKNSVGTIEDLKNDIRVLRSYTQAPAKDDTVVSNQELVQEVTQLKGLIYMSLVSCGLMFAATASVWIKIRKYLPYQEIKRILGKR